MANIRQKTNEKKNDNQANAIDSLMNFETVKYFNAEKYEIQCYQKAVKLSQKFDWEVDLSGDNCNLLNAFIYDGGYVTGYLIIAHMISDGTKTIGMYTYQICRLSLIYLSI